MEYYGFWGSSKEGGVSDLDIGVDEEAVGGFPVGGEGGGRGGGGGEGDGGGEGPGEAGAENLVDGEGGDDAGAVRAED